MPSYEVSGFEPPAPIARVTLRSLDHSSEVEGVPMLLDTGADISILYDGPRLVWNLNVPRSA